MIIFQGLQCAAEKEDYLKIKVNQFSQAGKKITIAAVLFVEDVGSQLYTRLKSEAAARVGISYLQLPFSITDSFESISKKIAELNEDTIITGIIIQKPTKKVWNTNNAGDFNEWWIKLVSQLALEKDVDGLHPQTIAAIADRSWREQKFVLPATCQAVVEILEKNVPALQQSKVLILGKSDLLGTPLYYYLTNKGCAVELLRKTEIEERMQDGRKFFDAAILVCATGIPGLVSEEAISPGVVIVDVGEPRGDVDAASIREKASFLTPVPGGVGPMTVVCLLENAVKLASRKSL